MKPKNRLLMFPFLTMGIILILLNNCRKDEPPESDNIVKDIDGNVYNTVTIGTQVWMIENLKTTKYSNGDLIGTTNPSTLDIRNESTPKYQWAYDGNETNVDTFGRIYTWYAVNDSRKIAPKGWHVATRAEWETLIGYLINNGFGAGGIQYKIANSLAATTVWKTYTQIGTIGYDLTSNNKSGFTAYPGGYRNTSGGFIALLDRACWWTATESNSTNAWGRELIYNQDATFQLDYPKFMGLSVRCLKD